MSNRLSRRTFLRTAAVATTLTSNVPSLVTTNHPALLSRDKPVRLGFIGTGIRGRDHIRQALCHSDVQIAAICDSSDEAVGQTLSLFDALGKPRPAVYQHGDEAFRQLLCRDDIDGVVIAAPGQWHTPMAIEAMKAGKYVGVEVSAAMTLQESWDLVEAFEATGSPYMLLENVCYRRDALMVLNMVRQGLFGQLTYAHCGYQHDLRTRPLPPDDHGDCYATHGLGPVSHWLNINRGNRFTALSSAVTKSRGLRRYVVGGSEANHADAPVNCKLDDVVTTVLQCTGGETVVLLHDGHSPRPYAPGFRVQGTEGMWLSDHDTIRFEHRTAKGTKPLEQTREPFAAYKAEFDHPLWKKHLAEAGPDSTGSFVMRAFIDSVKHKTQPPIDVYDAAVWRAISTLSDKSIAQGGQLIDVPDFTRGKWMTNSPIFGLNDGY